MIDTPPAFEQTRADGWTWTPLPCFGTYKLRHGTGLTYQMDASWADNASADDAATVTAAMRTAVHHRTSTRESRPCQ